MSKTYEYCVMRRFGGGDHEVHRGPWPKRECLEWIESWKEDGGRGSTFFVARREVGPWKAENHPNKEKARAKKDKAKRDKLGRPVTTLIGGQTLVNVHAADKCAGEYCTIHNNSDHHMKDWKQNWRADRGIMERVCPDHGVGHPDPDSPWPEDSYEWIHGCCGCCIPQVVACTECFRCAGDSEYCKDCILCQ